jgi:uncharacterized protein with HEPN domain
MNRKQPKDEQIRVRHMLDAARKAQEFLLGRTRDDLDTNDMLALALVRLLEIIGEAAKNVPPEIREACPQIPWSLVARTRDRLAHGYFDINLDRVWEMVASDLPPLIKALEAIPLETIPLLDDLSSSTPKS